MENRRENVMLRRFWDKLIWLPPLTWVQRFGCYLYDQRIRQIFKDLDWDHPEDTCSSSLEVRHAGDGRNYGPIPGQESDL